MEKLSSAPLGIAERLKPGTAEPNFGKWSENQHHTTAMWAQPRRLDANSRQGDWLQFFSFSSAKPTPKAVVLMNVAGITLTLHYA